MLGGTRDRGTAILVLASSALAPGCSGDHSGLAATEAQSAAATGPGGGGSGASSDVASSSSSGTGGVGGMEPPGPPKLTIVNGVADYDAIRLCALGYPNGENGDASPWPSAASGLAFAHGALVDPPGDLVPRGVDVRIHVLTGDLGMAAGKTCAEIVGSGTGGSGGGEPAMMVTALPVLPASVFEAEKSLLLVPAGCFGGATHTDPVDQLACGMGYSPSTPSATLVALAMSRLTDPGHVSLQAVHASLGMQTVDIRFTPGFDAAQEHQLGSSLTTGAIGPKPPFDALEAADYGILGQVKLKTYIPNDVNASSTVSLSQVLPQSTIEDKDFVDGRGFVVVAVGAYPGLASSWWHALTYTLVRADP